MLEDPGLALGLGEAGVLFHFTLFIGLIGVGWPGGDSHCSPGDFANFLTVDLSGGLG